MQTYISQLLADLRDRHDKQPPPVDYRLLHPQYADVPDALKYVVEWENAPEQSFAKLFCIPPEAFPPAAKLTEDQMQSLVYAIVDLWAAWRIVPDGVPEEVHISRIYTVLTDYWRNNTIIYTRGGTMHLEFCHYEPEECPWGIEHCSCKEFL